MKHIALCLDYDGCIANTSIIDNNVPLWEFFLKICRENPDLEVLTLVHFSARQEAEVDEQLSTKHQSESYFFAMNKIFNYLTDLLQQHALLVKVTLNPLLMPDIYNDKPHGHTLQTALADVDYSPEGRGILKSQQIHDGYLSDSSKITFIFAHVHSIPANAFYYFDNNSKILNIIKCFYSNSIGMNFIPNGVKIILQQYDNGALIKNHTEITGSGVRLAGYAIVLKKLAKLGSDVLPNIDTQCYAHSLKIFNRFYQYVHSPNFHECSSALPNKHFA